MKYISSPDGTGYDKDLEPIPGEHLIFRFRDLRRERTGMHGFLAVAYKEKVLAHDTFNLGRDEERRRFAKSTHLMLNDVLKEACTFEHIKHVTDIYCLEACTEWEQEQYPIVEYGQEDEEVKPLRFILAPYLLEDSGTFLFAPPGAGKSWIALLMALCVARGIRTFWPDIRESPVLFVNLERPARSLKFREYQLRRVLKVPGTSDIKYLHARGHSLKAVAKAIKKQLTAVDGTVVFLDSISRAGVGSLKEDESANAFTDMMNWLGCAYLAIGHSPRADASHLFGSQMFDAGAELGVKLTSTQEGNTLGIGLKVVKSNDTGKPPPQYLALDFDGGEPGMLTTIRQAKVTEFPELVEGLKPSLVARIMSVMEEFQPCDATAVADQLHVDRQHVATLLANREEFQEYGKEGKKKLYVLARRPISTEQPN